MLWSRQKLQGLLLGYVQFKHIFKFFICQMLLGSYFQDQLLNHLLTFSFPAESHLLRSWSWSAHFSLILFKKKPPIELVRISHISPADVIDVLVVSILKVLCKTIRNSYIHAPLQKQQFPRIDKERIFAEVQMKKCFY
jgi:hypothetical protein